MTDTLFQSIRRIIALRVEEVAGSDQQRIPQGAGDRGLDGDQRGWACAAAACVQHGAAEQMFAADAAVPQESDSGAAWLA